MARARTVSLILGGATYAAPKGLLINSCGLFEKTPAMMNAPYVVKSQVPPEIFSEFVKTLSDPSVIELTAKNVGSYMELANEFEAEDLLNLCATFSDQSPTESTFSSLDGLLSAQLRISELEELVDESERQTEIAAMENERLREEEEEIIRVAATYRARINAIVATLREQVFLHVNNGAGRRTTEIARLKGTAAALNERAASQRAERCELEAKLAKIQHMLAGARVEVDALVSGSR
jgi:vacuolar-type H+-ATPase subunit I/STV1